MTRFLCQPLLARHFSNIAYRLFPRVTLFDPKSLHDTIDSIVARQVKQQLAIQVKEHKEQLAVQVKREVARRIEEKIAEYNKPLVALQRIADLARGYHRSVYALAAEAGIISNVQPAVGVLSELEWMVQKVAWKEPDNVFFRDLETLCAGYPRPNLNPAQEVSLRTLSPKVPGLISYIEKSPAADRLIAASIKAFDAKHSPELKSSGLWLAPPASKTQAYRAQARLFLREVEDEGGFGEEGKGGVGQEGVRRADESIEELVERVMAQIPPDHLL
ncbi:hypothetical protein JCM10213_007044 [Rhodosporidiobolus nylandii]